MISHQLAAAVMSTTLTLMLVPAAHAAGDHTGGQGSWRGFTRSYAADRAIVGVTRGSRPHAAQAIEAEGGDVIGSGGRGAFLIVETPFDSADWVGELSDDHSMRYVEPDWALSTADLTSSDPYRDALWGARKIGAPAAWRANTGSKDVVVAVLDSGVDYTHEDLRDQMWVNPKEDPSTPADDDGNGWVNDVHGIDCANDDSDPFDDRGHGTHVAGTIGATARNGKGVRGIAWHLRIMALKVLGEDGTGYISDAVQCLYYAIDNGAHVTNNSWTASGPSNALEEAIRYAASRHQVFVAAAGNQGTDVSAAPGFPASYDNVISVAATNRRDQLAAFSNHGPVVDIGAPGVGILSTVPGGYARYSGTSMAAPHVAGALALLLAADPSLRSDAPRLTAMVLGSVDQIAGLKVKTAAGGRLDVGRAMAQTVRSP